jgi:hypothetical protein
MACHHHSRSNYIQLSAAPALDRLEVFEVFYYLHHFHIVSRLASRCRGFKTGQKYYYKSVCAAGFIFLQPQKIKKKRRKKKKKEFETRAMKRSVKHRTAGFGSLYRLCQLLVSTTMPSSTLSPLG